MAIANVIISQNFPCSGIPLWAVANSGIRALDISNGIIYEQKQIPYGSRWVKFSENNILTIPSGTVQSVTGLNTDNTDPQNPVIQISVDGVTITGAGTLVSPLVAATSGGYTIINVNTTPYTVAPTSGQTIYNVDTSGGAITMDFPTAVGNTAAYTVHNRGVNSVILDPFGAQTINGNATQTLLFLNTSVDIYSDGANLFIR